MSLARAACVEDLRVIARQRLPRLLFDYIDGGSYAEVTLARNVADLAAVTLRQRVLRDMSKVQAGVSLFGEDLSMPVILGPVGFAGMFARRGEVQAARAARSAGVPFTLSTVGICDVEEVTAGAGASPWFQLYVTKDRDHVRSLLARAAAAGCRVLVLTVDLPTPGARYHDVRSGMRSSGLGVTIARVVDGLRHPAWLRDVYLAGRPHRFGSLVGALPADAGYPEAWRWIGANFDAAVTWADLDFIRTHWCGTIVVKGILDIEDARIAADMAVDGIVVSNHGGRQLDGARSSIAALPEIAEAVGDRVTILFDGGIRSGLDVLKALSHGARAVMLGRAWAYALAAGGQAGVTRMLGMMREELRAAMVLTGCDRIDTASVARHR